MNYIEKKLVNLHKYKKIFAILTLILFFLSGFLSKEVYAQPEFIWPVPGHSRVSSPYGMRNHPKTGRRKMHTGIDIPAPQGTPVIASADGVVKVSRYMGSYGNVIFIEHTDGFSTRYAHNSKLLVQAGQSVSKGQTIALIGSTGMSTGPHSHFEVRINNQHKNPLNYVSYDGSIKPQPAPDGGEQHGSGGGGNRHDPKKYGSGYAVNGLSAITNESFFYQGVPKGHYQARGSMLSQIINFFATIGRYLISLVLNILFKLPFLGYASLVEVILTSTFNAVAGEEHYMRSNTNADLYVDPRRSVNVENIIFGRVELLNVDFFIDLTKAQERMEGLTGTGQSIEEINRRAEIAGNAGTATEYEAEAPEYENTPIGALRKNYAKVYYGVFSISIVMMLLILIGISIAVFFASAADKKSKLKEFLSDWFKSFATLLLSIMFVFALIKFNAYIIQFFIDFAKAILKDGLLEDTSSIYETVRTRAYDNKFSIGFPATIVYIILVWDTLKFTFIYIKRLIYVLVLAMLGPFANTYQMMSNILKGKPGDRSSIKRWSKEISYLVLMQTIHAAVYTVIMVIVFKLLTELTFASFIILIGLHSSLYKMTDYLKSIFKMSDGGGSALSDTAKANPVAESQTLLKAVTGKELLGDRYKTAKKQTKKLIGYTTKTAARGVGAITRGTINTGLFIGDALRAKKSENEIDDEFTPETKRHREQQVDEIIRKIDDSGIEKPETLRNYLNILSNEQLDLLINDPKSMEEFQINIEKQNLEKIFSDLDPKFSKPVSYSNMKKNEQDEIKQSRIDAIKNTKPFFLDEHGRYRVLAPIKTYNPKTGKYEVINPGSEEYFENLGQAFNLKGETFKEGSKVLVNSLKTGLALIGAPLVLVGALGDYENSAELMKTWVGLQTLGKSSGGGKNVFVQTKEDIDKYLLPYERKRKDKKVRNAIKSIINRANRGENLSYKDARVILDNARSEIVEMQLDEILKVIPDIEKKDIKRARTIKKSQKYNYKLRDGATRLPKEIALRREQNRILEELKVIYVLDMEKDLLDQSNYVKTYFEITGGKIDNKYFDENFDIKKLDANMKESQLKMNIYKDALKIKQTTQRKMLEAELYERDEKYFEQIKNNEQKQIGQMLDKYTNENPTLLNNPNWAIEQKEEILQLNIGNIEQKIETTDQYIANEASKIILNIYKDKKIEDLIEDADSGHLDNSIKAKLPLDNNDKKDEIIAESLDKISRIYEETTEIETLKILGKQDYDKAKEIENKLKHEIIVEKIEKIEKSNANSKDKEKMIEQAIQETTKDEMFKTKNKEKFLDKNEEELLNKYQAVKVENAKAINNKNVSQVVDNWKENSKDIVSGIEKLHTKYEKEISKRNEILNGLKDPDNLYNVFKKGRTAKEINSENKTIEMKLERNRKTKSSEEENSKELENILGKFYRRK